MKFCLPETPFDLSPFYIIFSLLSYVSRSFHCLLFHVSGPHPGITCLSPRVFGKVWRHLLIVTMGGLLSWHPAGVLLATSTPEPRMQLSILQEHTHPLQHARVPGPQGSQAYRSCSSILPPSLLSFSVTLSDTHRETRKQNYILNTFFP